MASFFHRAISVLIFLSLISSLLITVFLDDFEHTLRVVPMTHSTLPHLRFTHSFGSNTLMSESTDEVDQHGLTSQFFVRHTPALDSSIPGVSLSRILLTHVFGNLTEFFYRAIEHEQMAVIDFANQKETVASRSAVGGRNAHKKISDKRRVSWTELDRLRHVSASSARASLTIVHRSAGASRPDDDANNVDRMFNALGSLINEGGDGGDDADASEKSADAREAQPNDDGDEDDDGSFFSLLLVHTHAVLTKNVSDASDGGDAHTQLFQAVIQRYVRPARDFLKPWFDADGRRIADDQPESAGSGEHLVETVSMASKGDERLVRGDWWHEYTHTLPGPVENVAQTSDGNWVVVNYRVPGENHSESGEWGSESHDQVWLRVYHFESSAKLGADSVKHTDVLLPGTADVTAVDIVSRDTADVLLHSLRLNTWYTRKCQNESAYTFDASISDTSTQTNAQQSQLSEDERRQHEDLRIKEQGRLELRQRRLEAFRQLCGSSKGRGECGATGCRRNIDWQEMLAIELLPGARVVYSRSRDKRMFRSLTILSEYAAPEEAGGLMTGMSVTHGHPGPFRVKKSLYADVVEIRAFRDSNEFMFAMDENLTNDEKFRKTRCFAGGVLVMERHSPSRYGKAWMQYFHVGLCAMTALSPFEEDDSLVQRPLSPSTIADFPRVGDLHGHSSAPRARQKPLNDTTPASAEAANGASDGSHDSPHQFTKGHVFSWRYEIVNGVGRKNADRPSSPHSMQPYDFSDPLVASVSPNCEQAVMSSVPFLTTLGHAGEFESIEIVNLGSDVHFERVAVHDKGTLVAIVDNRNNVILLRHEDTAVPSSPLNEVEPGDTKTKRKIRWRVDMEFAMSEKFQSLHVMDLMFHDVTHEHAVHTILTVLFSSGVIGSFDLSSVREVSAADSGISDLLFLNWDMMFTVFVMLLLLFPYVRDRIIAAGMRHLQPQQGEGEQQQQQPQQDEDEQQQQQPQQDEDEQQQQPQQDEDEAVVRAEDNVDHLD